MRIAIATLFLLTLALPGLAATVTYTSEVPLTNTDWDEVLQLQLFDPALGALISAEVSFDAGFEGTFFFENTSPSPGTYRGEMDWDMVLTLPGDIPVVIFDEFIEAEGDLSAYDGETDFGGTSGVTIPIAADMDTISLFTGEGLGFFTGTGTIDLPINADAWVSLVAGYGSGSMGSTSSAFAILTVTYEYEEEVAVQETTWSAIKGLYR